MRSAIDTLVMVPRRELLALHPRGDVLGPAERGVGDAVTMVTAQGRGNRVQLTCCGGLAVQSLTLRLPHQMTRNAQAVF